jgi:hypothetical protein
VEPVPGPSGYELSDVSGCFGVNHDLVDGPRRFDLVDGYLDDVEAAR